MYRRNSNMKKNYILPVCYTVKVNGEDALAQAPDLTIGSKFEDDGGEGGMEILSKGEMSDESAAGNTAPTPTNVWDSVW